MAATLLMCLCPVRNGKVDDMYKEEFEAAQASGFDICLVDHDALVAGDLVHALKRIASGNGPWVYRGWMMSARVYASLELEMIERGYTPYTPAESYRQCHHLPGWYGTFHGITPRSVWNDTTPPFDNAALVELAAQLPEGPAIVKDYVKSEKQDWEAACFVPSVRDESELQRVVSGYCDRRGSDFEGGLVLREFVRLKTISCQRAVRPETNEWRVFWLDGSAIAMVPGFENATGHDAPAIEEYAELVRKIQSPFFTMDIAQLEDGGQVVIELGDGQVAGLPEDVDLKTFYQKLCKSVGCSE